MTVTINTQTPPITRAELDAVFNGNQKIIRAFEKLLNDVRATLPDAIISTDGDAAAALAAAQVAQATANTALANAAAAQTTANTALSTANTALADATALAAVDYLVRVASATVPNAHVLMSGTNVNFTVGTGTLTVSVTGAPPTGTAGGDLSGSYPNPTVAKFSGTPFGTAAGHATTDFLQTANNLSDLSSAATARTNLGLGTIATQNASNVAITGGTVNGASVGATTPSTGAFTTLAASAAAAAVTSTNTGGGNFQYVMSTTGGTFSGRMGVTPANQMLFQTNNATALTLDGAGNAIVPAGITTGSTTLHTTTVALGNGTGAQGGTLTNAPAAGNPTKWIPINDNGTTRYIPAW